MKIKTNLLHTDSLFTNTEIVFDLFVYQFKNGLLFTQLDDFDNAELKYKNKKLPSYVFGNATFFEIDTSNLTIDELAFILYKNARQTQSYQLVSDKPFKPIISAEQFEALTTSLQENYKKSDNEKIVTSHFKLDDDFLSFADLIDNDFDKELPSFYADHDIYKFITSTVSNSQFTDKKLLAYLQEQTPVMISSKGIVSYISSLNAEEEKPRWFGYGIPKAPHENEMFTMATGTYDDTLLLNYWEKPYHAEYERVRTRKKNGQYYADNRTHQELIKVRPVSSLEYSPEPMYSKNLFILVETLNQINNQLTLKEFK